ncbi:hypothetical protein P7D22_18005 [Lichenihabitans sp. Uapishka_5]|uniref:hypothetical protein n=1 Tax=Lichenihabitans sp. Uapishka_5 TaxID=3037302 RepID=UPI0029E80CF2|nr:hypothetical protein [Lichenihabitans sp. Uapishka_5]MDX7953059.1 hypothetical protein [Lichenihabitans sp. Uapishka_5]
MRSRFHAALAAAAVLGAAAIALPQGAEAGTGLPPVSGTLRMQPDEFGAARPRHARGPAIRRAVSQNRVEVIRGGLYPRASAYQALSPAERWATGGTGLSGLIGNTGNPYLGEARWGTADSATTGSGYAPRRDWRQRGLFTTEAEAPLLDRYGESPVFAEAGYGGQTYGAAPQLAYYGSGAPSTMGYYSSGSSAGPYGSPGGLATYRSGSYGYGPRVIGNAGFGETAGRQGCTCGPRIVTLSRHRRHLSAR